MSRLSGHQPINRRRAILSLGGVVLGASLGYVGAGLVALILAFGPISGAHFNPFVSLWGT